MKKIEIVKEKKEEDEYELEKRRMIMEYRDKILKEEE